MVARGGRAALPCPTELCPFLCLLSWGVCPVLSPGRVCPPCQVLTCPQQVLVATRLFPAFPGLWLCLVQSWGLLSVLGVSCFNGKGAFGWL